MQSDSKTHEQFAMNLSLATGVLMLVLKWSAYFYTGSVAIFSDAMETIGHIAAVLFAWLSMRLLRTPPDHDHHYGHDKISFFSAGVEGGVILLASITIFYNAAQKIFTGVVLEKVGFGTSLTAVAALVNLALGLYLLRVGKLKKSLILEANGKHVMTDVWTSVGAIGGLLLAYTTGWLIIDPLVAIVFGANIAYEAIKLIRRSFDGLMDKANPTVEALARKALDEFCAEHHVSYHRLRVRESGSRSYIDFHIQFEDGIVIERAHSLATAAENAVQAAIDEPSEVLSHLESTHHPPGHDTR